MRAINSTDMAGEVQRALPWLADPRAGATTMWHALALDKSIISRRERVGGRLPVDGSLTTSRQSSDISSSV